MPDVGIEPTMPKATVLQTAPPPWGLSGLAGVVGFEPTTHRLTADCAAIAPHAISGAEVIGFEPMDQYYPITV